jgi:hypothetical protein
MCQRQSSSLILPSAADAALRRHGMAARREDLVMQATLEVFAAKAAWACATRPDDDNVSGDR